MIVLAIKDEKNLYYCGMSTWDKDLRKAKFYKSKPYAEDVIRVNKIRKPIIVQIDIKEIKRKKENK